MNKIVALVVTYNRKEMLEENISALLNQKYSQFDILVVDNDSTDGTSRMMKKNYKDNGRILYENTGKNLGGAGGFHYGLKKAIELGYKYCWLMDDDTIPKENALTILVKKSKELNDNFSYLCSYVEWIDGSPCKMNQVLQDKYWYQESNLLANNHLLKLKSCTFVSVFVNLDCAIEVGLPVKEMFIYGDDHEYTTRLGKNKPGYFVFDSVVVHKMPSNQGYSIENVDENRISRYFYDSRNRLYRAKKEGFYDLAGYFYWLITSIFKILFRSKSKKIYRIFVILKGFLFGIFFNPKIEYIDRNK